MSKSSNTGTLLVAAATSTALLVGAALVWRRQQAIRRPRSTLSEIQGNVYATATDVLRLYPDAATGKTIVITGTLSGLGQYTARLLGTQGGAHVIMGVRNPSASEALDLVAEIKTSGNLADCFKLDLSSLESTKGFAAQVCQVLTDGKKIDVLVNNAGVLGLQKKTIDGFQLTWQVNCMAPALLTELLLPFMAETGRVINVSSEMHKYCFGASIVDKCPPSVKGKSAHSDYALSKACQIVHAHELNLRGTRAFAIEPGLVRTNVGRHMPQWMINLEYKLLGPILMRSLDQGCASIVYCCLVPDTVIGQDNFYIANCALSKPKANCSSVQEAERLRLLFRSLWKDYLQPEQ